MPVSTPFEPCEDGYWSYTGTMPWKKRMCARWMECGERHRCYHVLPHFPNKVCLLMHMWRKEDNALCQEVVIGDTETV